MAAPAAESRVPSTAASAHVPGLRQVPALSAMVAGRADAMVVAAPWLPRWLLRVLTRAAAWIEIAGGFGRSGPRGTAVVSVVPPRTGQRIRYFLVIAAHDVVVVILLAALAAWWWPAAAAVVVGMGLALAPLAVAEWRRGRATKQLKASTPPGAYQLRNFVADPAHRGAGRQLLASVCRDADEAGNVLYLDTVPDRLVAYYRDFGFEVRASEAVRHGRAVVHLRRMVREPRASPGRSAVRDAP